MELSDEYEDVIIPHDLLAKSILHLVALYDSNLQKKDEQVEEDHCEIQRYHRKMGCYK